jgi:hypothetical protein
VDWWPTPRRCAGRVGAKHSACESELSACIYPLDLQLGQRLLLIDVIGVVDLVVVGRHGGSSTLMHNAMLVASHPIGIVERFGRIGAGIEIGFAAPWIPLVEGVRSRCSSDHVSASE